MKLSYQIAQSVSYQTDVNVFISDMAMGWVQPWVGLGPKFSPMKWVGLGLVARN